MIQAKYLVYMLATSIATIIFLLGWTVWENHAHQDELAAAVVERQAEVNQFLRTEVCERLELRDEIQISYLKAAAARYEKADPAYAGILSNAALALQFTQSGCKRQLPGVKRPPDNG